MRIKSQNSKDVTSKLASGPKKFEFTLDLSVLKSVAGNKVSEKIFNQAKITANDLLAGIYFSTAKFVSELEESSDSDAKKYLRCLESSESCTYVYWGCGSCGGDWARVDAYCGSGGSEPDYSWCELC